MHSIEAWQVISMYSSTEEVLSRPVVIKFLTISYYLSNMTLVIENGQRYTILNIDLVDKHSLQLFGVAQQFLEPWCILYTCICLLLPSGLLSGALVN